MCGGGTSGDNGGTSRDPWAGMREVTVSRDRDSRSGREGGGDGNRRSSSTYQRPTPRPPVTNTPNQVVTRPTPIPPPVTTTPPPPVTTPPPSVPTGPVVDPIDAALEAAFGRGISGAENYFRGRGVSDTNQYLDEITAEAEQRRSGFRPGVDDIDTFFSDLGSDVYGDLTNQLRTSSLNELNRIAPTGFENTRLGNTADDEAIDLILSEQYNPMQDYINRLFARGTVTEEGLDRGLSELNNQFNLGFDTLQNIGSGFLDTGRAGARNIADTARQQASNADLATGFDTNAIDTSLDDYFGDFLGGLEGQIRGASPQDIFDTSQLSAFAGALGTGSAPIFSQPQGFEEEEPTEEEEESERTAF